MRPAKERLEIVKRMKQLTENKMALFNIASTAIVAGINFFTIPVFTRMLDTAGYGVVNIYVAWVQIFTVLVGLKADGSVASAKANLPEEEQDSYHLSILVMSTLFFVAIFAGCMLFLGPLSVALSMDSGLVVCMLVQSFGAFVISLFNVRFIFRKQAQLNFAVSVGLCVATTALSIVLIFAVFTGNDAYWGRVVGLVVPNALLALGLYVYLAASGRGKVKVGYWRFCLALTLPLIFHGLSQLLLAQTGKIAMQQFWGDSAAGVYSIAVVIVTLMAAIYNALNNAFVPFMYDDLAGKTGEGVKQRHFRNYMTMFTLGSCAFALLSPEILKLMSTDAYWGSIPTLPMLVIGQYCVFLYSFSVNYEFYRMKTKSVALGTILAAALNIALCLALVPTLGMMGAAAATMAAYIGLFLFHLLIARYRLGDRNYPVWAYFAGLGAVAAACLLCYPLADAWILRDALGALLLVVAVVRMVSERAIF